MRGSENVFPYLCECREAAASCRQPLSCSKEYFLENNSLLVTFLHFPFFVFCFFCFFFSVFFFLVSGWVMGIVKWIKEGWVGTPKWQPLVLIQQAPTFSPGERGRFTSQRSAVASVGYFFKMCVCFNVFNAMFLCCPIKWERWYFIPLVGCLWLFFEGRKKKIYIFAAEDYGY